MARLRRARRFSRCIREGRQRYTPAARDACRADKSRQATLSATPPGFSRRLIWLVITHMPPHESRCPVGLPSAFLPPVAGTLSAAIVRGFSSQPKSRRQASHTPPDIMLCRCKFLRQFCYLPVCRRRYYVRDIIVRRQRWAGASTLYELGR